MVPVGSVSRVAVGDNPTPYHAAMPRLSPLAEVHEAFARAENERRSRAVAHAGRGDPAAIAAVSQRAEIEWIAFGPDGAGSDQLLQVVGAYGPFEPEYAAIRRGAALVDSFDRSTLRVRGRDRRDFLNRMLTQDLSALAPGAARAAFWLNRRGRIDADLLVIETGDEILIDVDRFAAAGARESLERFIFSEEVSIEDRGADAARCSMHGPLAGDALERAGAAGAAALESDRAVVGTVAGARVVVVRRDQCGVPGFELFLDSSAAVAVWSALAGAGRPVGWQAYNTARIEGGTPLFRVDFGTESLPHETGVISSRVSFRKGCYLGQEIVARLEALGTPKQIVIGFHAAHRDADDAARIPVAGAQLRRPNEPMGTPIGVVTSSCVSPILRRILGFATVRHALSSEGTRLSAHADGAAIEIEVSGAPRSALAARGPAGGARQP